jgi:hypothetical protein
LIDIAKNQTLARQRFSEVGVTPLPNSPTASWGFGGEKIVILTSDFGLVYITRSTSKSRDRSGLAFVLAF